MRAAGRWIVDRLAGGSVAIMIPNRGFTQTNREGGPMFDPEADLGFAAGVREALAEHPGAAITVTEYDLHINDPAFATEVAETMFRMLGKSDKGCPVNDDQQGFFRGTLRTRPERVCRSRLLLRIDGRAHRGRGAFVPGTVHGAVAPGRRR